MPRTALSVAVAVAALATALTPASGAGAAAPSAAGSAAVAKAALVKGVAKVDKYVAAHGAPPSAQRGTKLVRGKAPAGVTVTYAAVTGTRPGYCASAGSKAMGTKRWFHDSWLGKTWRATPAQAASAGGACGSAIDHPPTAAEKSELKAAVDDAFTVVDAVEAYYDQDPDGALPALVDGAWLAAQGTTLTPGSSVVGYEVYDPEQELYHFCLVRTSGAWATFDEDFYGIVDKGTSGAACRY